MRTRGLGLEESSELGILLADHFIVPDHVEHQVVLEAIFSLGRAPGLTDEPAYVGSEHGCCVVEGEDRIFSPFLQFPLAHNRRPSALHLLVTRSGIDSPEEGRVIGMRITPKLSLRVNRRLQRLQQPV